MEFAKDLLAGLHNRPGAGGAAMPASQCDWHGLSARLQAAHAARIELHQLGITGLRAPRGAWGGSFAQAGRLVGAAPHHASPAVNPSGLGDGKAADGMVGVAEADWLGDGRG